jgi:hypothetical protein
MALFMLTVAGALSLVLIVRSIFVAENHSFLSGIVQFAFGLVSFITTAILSAALS